MDFIQIGLVFFGAMAIFLLSCKNEETRRWGYVFGLISQPFWFWAAIESGQWGIFFLSCFYTFSWIRGIWNFWVKPVKIKESV
jgi:hypothetical protein